MKVSVNSEIPNKSIHHKAYRILTKHPELVVQQVKGEVPWLGEADVQHCKRGAG